MVCSFAKVKCYLTCILLFAFSYHIFNTCPLGKPVDYELLESDYVCKVSHITSNLVYPYAAPAIDSFNEKVVVPVYDTYESSFAKPIVDSLAAKSTEAYVQHGKPLVNKYYPVVKTQAGKYFEIIKQKLIFYYQIAFVFAKENGEIYGKIAKEKSIEIYNITHNTLKTKVCPTISNLYDITKANFKKYGTKLAIQINFNYRFYVEPKLEALYEEFLNSPAGPYWKQFLDSTAFHYIKTGTCAISNALIRAFSYLQDNYEAFKADKFKLSQDFQNKSEFLKQEFNKILDAGFKIPNYEDIEFFKKLAKATEVESDPTTGSPEPTPTSEKYQILLKKIISDALNDFEEQSKKISDESIITLSESPREKLRELSKLTNGAEYSEAHQLLIKINDREAVPQVSRQDFRDVLFKHSEAITEAGNAAQEQISKVEANLKEKIAAVRKSIIDGFSEFSESTLTAYSSDIVTKGDKWDEWKKFNNVKQELMDFRDQILTSDPISPDFKKTVNTLTNTINVLLNDGQSYLAILRAKANIEFQAREKAEREAVAAAAAAAAAASDSVDVESENDEDYEDAETTSTIQITKTVVLNDEGQVVGSQTEDSIVAGTEATFEATQSTEATTKATISAKVEESGIPSFKDESIKVETLVGTPNEPVFIETQTRSEFPSDTDAEIEEAITEIKEEEGEEEERSESLVSSTLTI